MGRLGRFLENAKVVGKKANQFRELMVDRLRQVYWRLRSIQAAVGAASQAQSALVALVDRINAAGGPSADDSKIMADLASELDNLDRI